MNRFCLAAIGLATFASLASTAPPHASNSRRCIVYEVRVLSVPADAALAGSPRKEGELSRLNERQLKSLLRKAQSLPQASIQQLPKITAESGKEANCQIVEEPFFVTELHAKRVGGQNVVVPMSTKVELGTKLTVGGKVSADNASATVDVKYWHKQVTGPVEIISVTVPGTVSEKGKKSKPITHQLQVPDFETHCMAKSGLRLAAGESALIAGPLFTEESRNEYGVPVLSGVPYVGRLFTTVGIARSSMRKLLIVSARVTEQDD